MPSPSELADQVPGIWRISAFEERQMNLDNTIRHTVAFFNLLAWMASNLVGFIIVYILYRRRSE